MQTVNKINEDTIVVTENENFYTLKKIHPEDLEIYRKLKQINCVNIAKIIEFTDYEGDLCVKREYIQGVTLENYIEDKGPQDEKRTDEIILDIINGLKQIHSLNIVHRDITPNNIIIDREGKAVIIDFGISRLEKEGSKSDTMILGTPGYAAPEQFGFSQTTNRADIYALGVLMNFIRTGKMPIDNLPKGKYEKIIKKCTKMDFNDRYSSVIEIEKAIGGENEVIRTLRKVPGYNTYNHFSEAFSTIIYTLVLLLVAMEITTFETAEKFFKNIFLYFLILVAPMFIGFDIFNWPNKIKHKSHWDIIAVKCALIFIVMIFAGKLILKWT